MATSKEYIEYVMSSIGLTGNARYKKMFGEYMVYINDKPLLLVCDNNVFVKKLPEVGAIIPDAPYGFPYDGAKEHYMLDMGDTELIRRGLDELDRITPPPKSKKNRTKKEELI